MRRDALVATHMTTSLEIANRRLAARGAESFELVAFGESPRDGDIWICFKRPVAR